MIDEFLALLHDELLAPADNGGGVGLRMHFADIVLDELVRVGVTEDAGTRFVTAVLLSQRFVH